jgi:hypothetical protein
MNQFVVVIVWEPRAPLRSSVWRFSSSTAGTASVNLALQAARRVSSGAFVVFLNQLVTRRPKWSY